MMGAWSSGVSTRSHLVLGGGGVGAGALFTRMRSLPTSCVMALFLLPLPSSPYVKVDLAYVPNLVMLACSSGVKAWSKGASLYDVKTRPGLRDPSLRPLYASLRCLVVFLPLRLVNYRSMRRVMGSLKQASLSLSPRPCFMEYDGNWLLFISWL